MAKAFALLVGMASLFRGGLALPTASQCLTITSELWIPATTYTLPSTSLEFLTATTPELGTFSDVVLVPTTKTLLTLTTTVTDCTASTIVTEGPKVTVFEAITSGTTSTTGKRQDQAAGWERRQASRCTVTATASYTGGFTYVQLPVNATETVTIYTAWNYTTILSTTSKGTEYVISTATTTTCKACGPTVTITTSSLWQPSTITYDPRCLNPTSAYSEGGPTAYGLAAVDDTPYGGATARTKTPDYATCCQRCVEQSGCAASAWNSRTNECRLEFPANPDSGRLDCGLAAQAYYVYGPHAPMAPGTGWYMAQLCGQIEYAPAMPDDGT